MPNFKIRLTVHSLDSNEGSTSTSREVQGGSLMDVVRKLMEAMRAFRGPADSDDAQPE